MQKNGVFRSLERQESNDIKNNRLAITFGHQSPVERTLVSTLEDKSVSKLDFYNNGRCPIGRTYVSIFLTIMHHGATVKKIDQNAGF